MADQDTVIGIVGGGAAGLAAAWRLLGEGRRVRLYEASPRVGGRLRTEAVAGVEADAAVQLLSGGYDRLLAMAGDLGIQERITPVPGRDALWRRGRAHALEYGSVARMAVSGALPARLKMRMGLRYVPFLERNADRLDLNDPSLAGPLDRESIAEWGRRELGEDFVELLVYPLLAAYYGSTPEETSAAFFHALAHTGMGVRVIGIRGGAGAMAADLSSALCARGLELRTDAAVERLDLAGGSIRLRVAGEDTEHGAVVVAVPPREALRLMPASAWLADVPVRSTATLVLALDESPRTGWFGLSVPRVEPPGERVAAVCVQEEKSTDLVPTGKGALVIIPAPEEAERWAGSGPREALERALPALDQLLPGVRETIREARLIRFPGGVSIPTPGRLAPIPGATAGPGGSATPDLPPNVVLAGDYLVAPTVEGAVRSGERAAERIIAGA